MLLQVFLLWLALLLLALLHYECCSMMSLLLRFFPRPCRKSLLDFSGPWKETFCIPNAGKVFWSPEWDLLQSPMPENSGPWSQASSSSRGLTFMAWRHVKYLIPGTGRLFRHLGMQKVSLQGPEDFSDMENLKKVYGWREKFSGISSEIFNPW